MYTELTAFTSFSVDLPTRINYSYIATRPTKVYFVSTRAYLNAEHIR